MAWENLCLVNREVLWPGRICFWCTGRLGLRRARSPGFGRWEVLRLAQGEFPSCASRVPEKAVGVPVEPGRVIGVSKVGMADLYEGEGGLVGGEM